MSTRWKVQQGRHGHLAEEIPALQPQNSFNPKSPSLNVKDRCNYVTHRPHREWEGLPSHVALVGGVSSR